MSAATTPGSAGMPDFVGPRSQYAVASMRTDFWTLRRFEGASGPAFAAEAKVAVTTSAEILLAQKRTSVRRSNCVPPRGFRRARVLICRRSESTRAQDKADGVGREQPTVSFGQPSRFEHRSPPMAPQQWP